MRYRLTASDWRLQGRVTLYHVDVVMKRNTQRFIAALLVFSMIAVLVIAIFSGAADSLPL